MLGVDHRTIGSDLKPRTGENPPPAPEPFTDDELHRELYGDPPVPDPEPVPVMSSEYDEITDFGKSGDDDDA